MAKPTEGPYRVGTDVFGGVHVFEPGGDRLTNDRMNGTENWPATARLLAKSWEMRANMEALEKAETAHANCDECRGEDMPELCPKCFPLFDAVRVQRRALLREIDGDSQ